ncbi:MAG TPA: DUF3795 domain-containing protein [Candidatus Lokiarchaeia archaeon]|nr:DUF3795 domain-containing protein [Candidatus Lokiarchaeia archaeon]
MEIRDSKKFEDGTLIAPCGINCGLCRAYLRVKKPCNGCRGGNTNKSNSCLNCKIKNCEILRENRHEYCHDCSEFPCKSVEHLDFRYRTRYHVSPIENLAVIKTQGTQHLLDQEKERWTCKECGGMICMHKGLCIKCGAGSPLE